MAQDRLFDAWDGEDVAAYDDPFARDFYPGERIGAPPPSRAWRIAKNLVTVAVLAGVGWLALATEATWRPLLTAALNEARPSPTEPAAELASTTSSPVPQTDAAAAPIATDAPPREIADIPGTAPTPPSATAPEPQPAAIPAAPQPGTASKEDITTASIDRDAPAPLPAPEPEPNDPAQKRAAAIGLHPRVSKVLLNSMTDSDFRNAGIAIRKALAEASDDDKFIWPREAAPKAAKFQIHFVEGASADCRRYIVTVVKNGWTTTAPPMEKCGIAKPKQSAARNAPAPRID